MFKHIRNCKAQVVIGEYVLVIFIAVTAITAMTIFFRRAIMGRIRDARMAMDRMVFNVYVGNIYLGYEPYYANRIADTVSTSDTYRYLEPTGPKTPSGKYTATINEFKRIQMEGTQLPPRNAD